MPSLRDMCKMCLCYIYIYIFTFINYLKTDYRGDIKKEEKEGRREEEVELTDNFLFSPKVISVRPYS